MVYFIVALKISKKTIETGSVTSPRYRHSIHLSNYWWAGISNYAYSTMLEITEIYIFLLLYFTSVLLLIMWSQSASIAWTVTSAAAFYHCWSYKEHSVLYIFDIGIVCPYEMCEFIWFSIWSTSAINLHAYLILLIQLWAMKTCRNFVAGVAKYLLIY